MGVPSNKGINTGSAQVYDISRTGAAFDKFFSDKNKKSEAQRKAGEAAKLKKDAAIKELSGEYSDYDVNKLQISDVDAFQAMISDLHKKYDGEWGGILNNDPEVSNAYRNDIANIKKFAATSIDSKPQAQDFAKEIAGNPLYSDEFQENFSKNYGTPGFDFNRELSEGNLKRDVARGDFYKNMNSLFVNKGDELYNEVDKSYTGKDGSFHSEKTKSWKTDDEAFPKFKETVGRDVEMMSDININYANLPEEERINAAYKDFKNASEISERKTVDRAAKPDDSGDVNGDGLGKSGKYDFAIRNEGSKIDPLDDESKIENVPDSDIITISKKSGSALAPFPYKGTVGIVSEIVKTKKGGWEVVFNVTKDDHGTTTFTGETKTLPVDRTMESHLESEYGIKDLESFSNKLKRAKASDSKVDLTTVGFEYN